MDRVFLLHHEYEWCDRDEIKLIGVYATQAEAELAIQRLQDQPGFRDWPDGFSIDRYQLGCDHWIEGFVTTVNILIPLRSNSDTYKAATSVWRPGEKYEITEIYDSETAMFGVGDIVQCKELVVSDENEPALVAVARVLI